MLRSHMRENNRRLGVLEKKFEKVSRRIVDLRQRLKELGAQGAGSAAADLDNVTDPDQKQRD